jgi:hypothetical protein
MKKDVDEIGTIIISIIFIILAGTFAIRTWILMGKGIKLIDSIQTIIDNPSTENSPVDIQSKLPLGGN